MGKTRKIIGVGCGVILAVAIIGFLTFGYFFSHALEQSQKPVTNISKYPTIRADWPSNLVAHFPAALPSSAMFHFHPGFLQGGAAIQARVPMSSEQGASLLSQYSAHALATYQGGDVNDHSNISNGIPTTFFYTSGTQDLKFPSDFSILVLHAVNRSQKDPWNHGDSSGIAVSAQRHEVVYWAESW